MARIIVAATPIPGHVAPLRRIAVDLASRGHDIVFISGSLFRGDIERAGLRFASLSGIADYPPARQAEVLEGRRDIPPGPAQLNYDFTHVFYEPIPDQHDAVQRVLAEAPGTPTLIMTDQSFMGHWPVRLGAPGLRPDAYIGIGVVPLSLNSADTAPFGLGLPPDGTPEGRARNLEQNRMVEAMFSESTDVLKKIFVEMGASANIPFPMDAIVSLPDRFLQLAIPGVEYPRSDAPAGLSFVGSLPPEPAAPGSLPVWWDDVTAADRVILVTQGTLANWDLSQLVHPALHALAQLDALVVATTGRPDATVPDVPANARVAGFLPYSALLPHADIMITNGGYGGCLQALSAGVPLIIAGQTEDKVEVAARLAWTGAAVNLATDTPVPAAIRAAVTSIDNDPSYRRHAQRLQAESAQLNPFAEIAHTVESIMA